MALITSSAALPPMTWPPRITPVRFSNTNLTFIVWAPGMPPGLRLHLLVEQGQAFNRFICDFFLLREVPLEPLDQFPFFLCAVAVL